MLSKAAMLQLRASRDANFAERLQLIGVDISETPTLKIEVVRVLQRRYALPQWRERVRGNMELDLQTIAAESNVSHTFTLDTTRHRIVYRSLDNTILL